VNVGIFREIWEIKNIRQSGQAASRYIDAEFELSTVTSSNLYRKKVLEGLLLKNLFVISYISRCRV